MTITLRFLPAVLFACLCTCMLGAQTTIHVPGDQPTIQAGINAAPSGAIVLVAPGTYYENIDFKGKAITVTSAAGAGSTILDGGNGHTAAASFVTQETREAVLNGFTIQNGGNENDTSGTTGSSLGGVYVAGSQPTLSNNILTHNYCHTIYSNGGSPLIENNEIDNTLDSKGGCGFAGGAAIWLSGSLTYSNNGIFQEIPAVVLGNTIQNNTASGKEDAGGNGGVGVAIWAAYALIEKNIIRNNITLGEGAIYGFNTDEVMVIGNLIYGNTAASGSAGIDLEPPESTVGPFIGIIASNTVYNNTLTHATADLGSPGSQVFLSGNLGQYILINNVIVANSPGVAAMTCGSIYNYLSITPVVFDHNDIYNSSGPAYGGPCADQTGIYGNLSVDPQVANPASDDFHLLPGSPVIDVGNNSAPMLLSLDLDGRTRIEDSTGLGYPVVDMGAYEVQGLALVAPTLLTLTPSTYTPYLSNFKVQDTTPFTLTASLSSTAGTPAGPVTFYEDLNPIGTSMVGSDGSVTITLSNVTPGTHAFLATFPGQGAFPAAVSAKFFILFPKVVPTLRLTSSVNPSIAGSPVTFTVVASSPDGSIPSPITLLDMFLSTTLASLVPDATGTATYTTSTLSLGSHLIAANFAGNSNDQFAAASLVQTVLSGYPTTTTVTSSLNPSNYLQAVTFTAQVSAASGNPSGSVTFLDGVSAFATVPLSASGGATTTIASLGATSTQAPHTITAQYVPVGSFGGSSASLRQVVNGFASRTTLTVSPTAGIASGTYVLTASVVNSAANSFSGTPSGTVTFSFGGGSSMATLSNGTATASVTGLAPGQNTVTAVYQGDSVFAGSTSNPVVVTVTATPTALTLSSTANPSLALAPVSFSAQLMVAGQPAPAGLSVLFTLAGGGVSRSSTASTNSAGISTYTVADLLPGSYGVTASFAATATLQASSSPLLSQSIVANASSTTLVATPNPAYQHQLVSLTASVASSPAASGTLTFLDGGSVLGAMALSSAGSATLTISTLAPGTHLISAIYAPGSSAFVASQSQALSLVVQPQDFVLSTESPSLTIQTEHHQTITLNLSSVGSFSGPIAFSCGSPLPAWLTCQLPASATMLAANGSVPVSLTLDTDAVLGYRSSVAHPVSPLDPNSIFLALTLPLSLSGFGALRFRGRSRRGLSWMFALFACTLIFAGCSGKYPASTPPGSYTLQISASGTSTGSAAAITHTLPLVLEVTP